MPKEIIIRDSEGDGEWWEITIPAYNKKFVDDLKREVPPSCRRWDPQMLAWVVIDAWMPRVEELLVVCFPEAEVSWYE